MKVGDFQFVQIERLVRLHDGRSAFHVPFNVKGVFLVGVGKVLVAGMLCYIKLVAEKRPHPSQLQDTLASVHHRDLVLGHQLFATMSSDELKKVATIKEFLFVATILIIFQPVSYCLTCIIRECEL